MEMRGISEKEFQLELEIKRLREERIDLAKSVYLMAKDFASTRREAKRLKEGWSKLECECLSENNACSSEPSICRFRKNDKYCDLVRDEVEK